jgi:hypothetical protein
MPVGRGNVLFVDSLAQGQTMRVTQPLIVDGAAQAKAYSLPVALSYACPDGIQRTDVQRLSLIVRRRVEMQVAIYAQPEQMIVRTPAQLSLEVLNVGRGTVDIVGLRATGLNMSVVDKGTPFVGPLDPGGSAPLDVAITPTRSGPAQLTVHVEYRDDLNQVQTLRQALTIDVQDTQPSPEELDTPSAPAGGSSPPLWSTIARVARGLVGLGS